MSKLAKTIALAVLAGAIARGLRGKYNRNSHSGHGVQKSRYGIDANELVDFVAGTRATFEKHEDAQWAMKSLHRGVERNEYRWHTPSS